MQLYLTQEERPDPRLLRMVSFRSASTVVTLRPELRPNNSSPISRNVFNRLWPSVRRIDKANLQRLLAENKCQKTIVCLNVLDNTIGESREVPPRGSAEREVVVYVQKIAVAESELNVVVNSLDNRNTLPNQASKR